MTCAACAVAEKNPETGHTNAFCKTCMARSLAQSPHAFDAVAGKPEALYEKIGIIWKHDGAAGRAAVWQWMKRFKSIRGKT